MNEIYKLPALTNLVKYYSDFWIWNSIIIFINIVAFISICNYSKRYNFDIGLQKFNRNFNPFRIYFFPLLFLLIAITMIWFTINLNNEDVDIMEHLNIKLSLNQHPESYIAILDKIEHMLIFAHQPLYPLLLSSFIKFIDLKYYYFFLRLVSVFFAILTIYLTYIFSFMIFKNKFVSYSAIIFLSVHNLFFFYARRVEPYAMFSFFSLLSYYYFWKIFITGKEKKLWKYCLVNLICFFTHYLIFIIILSQILTIFTFRFKKNHRISFPSFLFFVKSMVVFNFNIIIWSPFIYISLFNNMFIFEETWSNNFYIKQEYIFSIINSIIKLVLGLPHLNLPNYFFIFLILFIIFIIYKLRNENTSFYILIYWIIFSSFLYGLLMLGGIWNCIGRLYFNLRHFTWQVPFIAIIYGYSFYLLRKQMKLYKKIIGFLFLFLFFSLNFYFTHKMVLTKMNPSYREALGYIRKKFDNNDWIGWPCSWLPIEYNANGIFNDAEKKFFGEITPINLLEKKIFYKRFWILIPREDYFQIPHLNIEFLDKYLNFLKENLNLEYIWRGNKIELYLFNTQS